MTADNILLQLDLDPHSGEPIYRQLMEQIKRLIASNKLNEGDLLPSVRRIAERFTVNPMTISKAYSLLEAEKIVIRQRGKGMKVLASQTTNDQQDNLATRLSLLTPALEQLKQQARQLDLSSEQVIDLWHKINQEN